MALTRPNLSQLNTTSNVSIVDPITLLHKGSSGPNQDVGFVINRGTASNVALFWDETNDSLTVAYTPDSGVPTANISVTSLASVSFGNLYTSGDATIAGNLTVTGNTITVQREIVTVSEVITGTITADGFIGDGSQLTGIVGYGNANVAAYLPGYSGTITSVSASGNISTSSKFVGNGAFITNVPGATNYTNANVAAYLPTYSGNIGTINSSNLNLNGNINLLSTKGNGILIDSSYGWKSIEGTMTPTASGASAPTLATYMSPFEWWSYAGGDSGNMVFSIPNDYAPGTDLYLDIHWGHNGIAVSGSFTVNLYVTTAKGFGQDAFAPIATNQLNVTSINIANTPQYQHRTDVVQLSVYGGSSAMINSSDLEPGSLVMIKYVTATVPSVSNGTTFLFSADVQYQSTNLPTLNRTPNFYS